MTKAELRLYFQAWMDSRLEIERLAGLDPSPAVDHAYARAVAEEVYDRANYVRLRKRYLAENGVASCGDIAGSDPE